MNFSSDCFLFKSVNRPHWRIHGGHMGHVPPPPKPIILPLPQDV